MRSLVLLPEMVVVGAAVLLLVASRLGRLPSVLRVNLSAIGAGVVLVALILELWLGGRLVTLFGGAFVQDRFALFAKAAVLLTVGAAIAVTDWAAEDSAPVAIALALLSAFGVMVAASAGDFVGLWAGLELAAACTVVLVGRRRPDLALRLLIVGGVATALFVVGFAFVYATTGTADLTAARHVMARVATTLPLAIPVLLMLGGLALRAGIAPFHLASVPASLGASPLGAGLLLGVAAGAALIVAIKVVALLMPSPEMMTLFLQVVAGVAMVGGGAAALAVRAPRVRLAYLAVGQVGWVAAGLATHFQGGLAGSLFLAGAFMLAATCGPAVLGGAEGGEHALAGMGRLRPARAFGIALVFLSLAGAPPLAGFFGEFAVGAALGTLRVLYIQSPPEEGRRAAGFALPALTFVSSAGAVALCIAILAVGAFANPIMGLAYQGAEALTLR